VPVTKIWSTLAEGGEKKGPENSGFLGAMSDGEIIDRKMRQKAGG
jgi:hypothetical protein